MSVDGVEHFVERRSIDGCKEVERGKTCCRGIHSREPVCNGVLFSRDVADLKDEALQEYAPADNDGDLARLDPDEVAMVCFEDKRFATKIIVELDNSVVEGVGFLLEGVPIDGSTREFVGRKRDGLMYHGVMLVSVYLEENRTIGMIRGV